MSGSIILLTRIAPTHYMFKDYTAQFLCDRYDIFAFRPMDTNLNQEQIDKYVLRCSRDSFTKLLLDDVHHKVSIYQYVSIGCSKAIRYLFATQAELSCDTRAGSYFDTNASYYTTAFSDDLVSENIALGSMFNSHTSHLLCSRGRDIDITTVNWHVVQDYELATVYDSMVDTDNIAQWGNFTVINHRLNVTGIAIARILNSTYIPIMNIIMSSINETMNHTWSTSTVEQAGVADGIFFANENNTVNDTQPQITISHIVTSVRYDQCYCACDIASTHFTLQCIWLPITLAFGCVLDKVCNYLSCWLANTNKKKQ